MSNFTKSNTVERMIQDVAGDHAQIYGKGVNA